MNIMHLPSSFIASMANDLSESLNAFSDNYDNRLHHFDNSSLKFQGGYHFIDISDLVFLYQ